LALKYNIQSAKFILNIALKTEICKFTKLFKKALLDYCLDPCLTLSRPWNVFRPCSVMFGTRQQEATDQARKLPCSACVWHRTR